MAAKGKYEFWITDKGLSLVTGWARDGLTEKQICHNIGISEQTINDWKKRFPEFLDALKEGKEVADYEVENALFKSACGYFITEEEEKLDMKGRVINTKKKKFIPPNTTAQIFWLKNREKLKWRDKPTVEDSDEYEDDGLIKALSTFTKELFKNKDDSDMFRSEQETAETEETS